MSYQIPHTPLKPLPGAYLQTPAQSNLRPGQLPNSQLQTSAPSQQNGAQRHQQPSAMGQSALQSGQVGERKAFEDLKPIERALKTINETLNKESSFPELDNYVGQGPSSEYDISSQPAWAPFQRVKMYDIPEKIFEQYNRAQFSTKMGLFAELSHAWVAIDNGLYLWDYTQPDPPIIGYEDQPNTITAVKLVTPRSGIFNRTISRMLVVATPKEIHLVGVATQPMATGGVSIALYSTNMKLPTKGMDVRTIVGSAATGRIFFSGTENDDVCEMTYQQEERWFQDKTAKINHTGTGLATFAPSLSFGAKSRQAFNIDMVVDDTRNLLYTLSSHSTIRVFHMSAGNGLSLAITKHFTQSLNDISHMLSAQTPSDLITNKTHITAIAPISSREASNMHLMATTSTGCRIFMSATSASYYSSSRQSSAPTSMIVKHVKFPPPDVARPQNDQSYASGQIASIGSGQALNTSSKALVPTRMGARYPPGYSFCFVPRDGQRKASDVVFISAPDTGRIALLRQDTSSLIRYPELGLWLNLGARAEDVGLISQPFAAVPTPQGFANELSVQYDKPSAEVAILTNVGIHTLRRRRLVDIFAATLKIGGGDNGLEGEIKKFIRLYGRSETASTALAVACGQGLDVTSDSRLAQITDPEVLEYARKAFIEYGGKPQYHENNLLDHSHSAIDLVQPSPRHEGLAIYVARLVRSIWKSPILMESNSPVSGFAVLAVVSSKKLQSIAQDLQKLKEFLNANKSLISGLAGPDALDRATNKHEELALQAEHRALHAQLVLIDNMIEGIAFVQVLFDERLEEIILMLSPETRQQVRNLTYESLFGASSGKELAKELVKAIVNRNIANGSNVETVAEALRRKCGSFCSADDVIIFKAQEQLKRSSEAGSDSELGRNLLNESLRLFTQVAGSLEMEQLQWAVSNFTSLQFYAGAIQLALTVAYETDRGNRALSWIQEGRPSQDPRSAAFESRKRCYNLIHEVITSLDQMPPSSGVGSSSTAAKRRSEAYAVIDSSDDEAFQTDLYDWYLSQGKTDRILEIQSPYIVTYLQRRSLDDIAHADLLWKYHTQSGQNHQAADVQLALAKSDFSLSLDRRIEYLSRAKANASTPTPGIQRAARHQLLREVSDLLDLANIQSDILQELKVDERIADDRRIEIVNELNGRILPLTTLYNQYADQASYYDLCLLIYQAADHRNPADVRATWQNLLESVHAKALQRPPAQSQEESRNRPEPYQVVAGKVFELGKRLNLDENIFPISDVLVLMERYAYGSAPSAPKSWVIDTLANAGVPWESMYRVMESMWYSNEAPFEGRNRGFIATDLINVVKRWFQDSDRGARGAGKILGGEHNAAAVSETLAALIASRVLDRGSSEDCSTLRMLIEQVLR